MADITSTGPIEGKRPVHLGWITVSVMGATVMQALDMTIANVALPNMQGSLLTTQEQIAWVLTSYIVTSAIMMPPTGFLAGRFGRKRLLVVAVSGFTAASMLCGIATSLEEMVTYRILQGGFGAFLVPLSQAVLLDVYPREKHATAMAIWGVGVMLGPILGPTIGGYLTEYYDWRWVFYINLPVGILALFGILTFVHETEKDRERQFDWFGFVLLGLAVGAFQLMLDRGELKDWFESTEIIIEGTLAAVALYMFVVHSATASRKPFVDPHIFADRNFVVGLTLIFIFGGSLLTGLTLLPPFLQNLMDYPVVTVGVVLAPRGIGAMIAMYIVSLLGTRVDMRILLVLALVILAWTMWLMTRFTLEVSTWTLIWTGFVQGVGLGFFYTPLNVASFWTLPARHRTEAAGMYNLMRNLGASIAVSVLIGLVTRYTQVNHAELVGRINPYDSAGRGVGAPDLWSLAEPAGRAALNDEVTRQAAAIAYINDFWLMMWVAIASIPLVFLFRLPRQRTDP